MAEIEEVRKSRELGFTGNPNSKYIWHACVDCGKERWVQYLVRENTAKSLRCRQCLPTMADSRGWKGGRRKTLQGYILIKLSPEDFYFPMSNNRGCVPEHRLVMAQSIGRCLTKSEAVHHKDGVKDNNDIKNLELLSQANHNLKSRLCSHCELRKEIRFLRWGIKELRMALQIKLKEDNSGDITNDWKTNRGISQSADSVFTD